MTAALTPTVISPNASLTSGPCVWITGADGLIGNALVQSAPSDVPSWRVTGLNREILELTDFAAVEERFNSAQPSLIIHCAALSKSPACQANPRLARKVNVEVTRLLSQLSTEIPFIFFSSDLVFDGRKGNYIESDAPNPLSIYAETKLEAEQLVQRNSRHTVIRTSLNAGASPGGGRSFNEEICLSWKAGKTLNLFDDEYRCPLHATVTARAIWQIARVNATGLYHLAGSERLSRWEIGQLLAVRHPELNPKIHRGLLKDYEGPPRSPDTSLICAKLQALLPFTLPGFSEWLRENPQAPF